MTGSVMNRASAVVTVLFTDLVGSTELLARTGDEEAQRIFRAHRELLAEAAAAHGGEEVKWLGDGLMVVFSSAADAVDCAIAMQQAARRVVRRQRLAIRVGLNCGEIIREDGDYFGLPVVVARRLCDHAEGGEILCTDMVAGLLAGRPGFSFDTLGPVELKGVPGPAALLRVCYESRAVPRVPVRLPFVGRHSEMEHLGGRLAEAGRGRGGLAIVAGEPGIGKTRLVEELAEAARRQGWLGVWGRCLEGDWAPPYAPFIEALEADIAAHSDEVRADIGQWATPLRRVVPGIGVLFPEWPEPVSLQSDEERLRLMESVAQYLVARSERAPVLLCLDDLHWADRGTIAMLRHVARVSTGHRILVVGTYRDVEVDRGHPLADTLRALRREVEHTQLSLRGLAPDGTAELLASVQGDEVPSEVGEGWARDTDGNPFFIRELLRHVIEMGARPAGGDEPGLTPRPLGELGLPSAVRDVVARRLERLSDAASELLTTAAAFEGPFRFDVVTGVAGLGVDTALDALDETLAAHMVQSADQADAYVFTHTLIRQTAHEQLSPSRRVRLHRRVAEALEAACSTRPTPAESGEIAAHFHHSASLPGADRGVPHAIAAATHAETSGAGDDAVRFLRMALELLPPGDGRRPHILGRLWVALAWAATFDEALVTAAEDWAAIAAAEGEAAASDYLTEAVSSCLASAERLAALEVTGLLDTPPRPELDQLTAEAAQRVGAAYSLVTLVDDHRQFFASSYGLPVEIRETPLEYSFCKYVAAFAAPLQINNALTHPLGRDNLTTKEFGVRCYLGVPLRARTGHALGSICVGDFSPRHWTPEDEAVLEELGQRAMAVTEIAVGEGQGPSNVRS